MSAAWGEGARPDTVRYTVPPGTHSTIEVDMEPGAACWVSPAGDGDPGHRLRAFADDDGIARFTFRPAVPDGPAAEPAVVVVDGAPGRRYVELHLRLDQRE